MKRFVALLPLALTLGACSQERTAPEEIVRPVLTMVIAPVDQRQTVLVGSVEPRVSAQLAFRLLGRVMSREVDIGDHIVKGKTIASLDPTQLQLQLQGARANLASALAQAVNASGSEERQRQLLESKNTPQAVYDAARQARDSANAGVEQAQAAVSKAEEQLGYAQLFCDFDGVVTAVGAEVGQVVNPGQMVVTVARADQRDAVIDVPSQMTGDIKLGTKYTVALQAAPGITATGEIREVAPQADSATRTRRVRLALEDAPPAFRLGSTIRATVATPMAPTIIVPSTALLEDGGKTQVWLVAGDTVSGKEVTVAERTAEGIVIKDGLKEGDRVVTAGVHSLKEGQKIKLDGEGPAQ